MKNSQKLLNICTIKKNIFFFVYMYKMDWFEVVVDNVEVIKYGGKTWINQRHLQGKLGIPNIADITQYYSDEF